MPAPTIDEFKLLVKSKTQKIKIYQQKGYWRIDWYGGQCYYTSLGVGKGYEAWEKSLDIAVKSIGKDSFVQAALNGLLIGLEKKSV